MDFSEKIALQKPCMIKAIQELVRIDSVEGAPEPGMPFGRGPAQALKKGLEICQELGFRTKNLDNYIGFAEFGEGDEVLGILGHVDVVPVGDGWTMDPFCAQVKGNLLYGRGSYDDKGGLVAAMHALKAVADSGCKFNRRVRIILGANEETGMADIPYYLEKEGEPDMAFSPDSPFPAVFGEKGVLDFDVHYAINDNRILSLHGGDNRKFTPALCSVTICASSEEKKKITQALQTADFPFKYDIQEKQEGLLEITTHGTRVFAVRPYEGQNAITYMVEVLRAIDFLDKEISGFCNYYMEKLGYSWDGSNIGCSFQDDISTPLTLSVDMIEKRDNEIVFSIHSRFPVTAACDTVVERIKAGLETKNACVDFVRVSPAHYVDKKSLLVSTLMDVYKEVTGDSEAEPVTMEGGTYARTLKNAVAFGPLFPGEPQVAHSADEYVNLDSLEKAANIYAQAIYRLCCEPM